MLAKLLERLAALARARSIQRPLRWRAVRRMRARHKGQAKAEREGKAAQRRSDELRAEGRIAAADRQAKRAMRLAVKAERERTRSIVWKRRAKTVAQRLHKINTERESVEAEIEEWKRKHEPRVEGNKVRGGTAGERFILGSRTSAANCASGKRRNFYSMPGTWDCKHELAPGPEYGERSDCSQWGTGICWSAGLPDPNGQSFGGGYTGTALGQHNGWQIVSERTMRQKGWGIVIYLRWPGDTIGHHWENYVGEGGDGTVGHGTAAVDAGVIDLFGDGLYACLICNPDNA